MSIDDLWYKNAVIYCLDVQKYQGANRGIRRRLAPMLGNNRRRLELAISLLFSLPGTPMMQYAMRSGSGTTSGCPERECARCRPSRPERRTARVRTACNRRGWRAIT